MTIRISKFVFILACIGILFGMLGKVSIKQVSHADFVSVSVAINKVPATERLDSNGLIYEKLQRDIEMKIALSNARRNWNDFYTVQIAICILIAVGGGVKFGLSRK